MELESLHDLLVSQLRDIYSAERQLLQALPDMAETATLELLKDAFDTHFKETEGQLMRLDSIATILGIKLYGKKCVGMEGLVAETVEAIQQGGEDLICDAGIIAAAQRIEHYEISAYGTALAIAEALGFEEVVELLQASLDEESTADEKLTEISQSEILDVETLSEQDDEISEDLMLEEQFDSDDEGKDDDSGSSVKVR